MPASGGLQKGKVGFLKSDVTGEGKEGSFEISSLLQGEITTRLLQIKVRSHWKVNKFQISQTYKPFHEDMLNELYPYGTFNRFL